jgi:hypothetical protein
MKKDCLQVKHLDIVLKDLEPFIKNVQPLITGRDFSNFSLRPREFLGNWLICAVANFNGHNTSFQEDPENSDGIIFRRHDKFWIRTEHVAAMKIDGINVVNNGDDFILKKMQSKFNKGDAYAKNKMLVVFVEGVGQYHPGKIVRLIKDKHGFTEVWLWGLEKEDGMEYHYNVIPLSMHPLKPYVYKVIIQADFNRWRVEQIFV